MKVIYKRGNSNGVECRSSRRNRRLLKVRDIILSEFEPSDNNNNSVSVSYSANCDQLNFLSIIEQKNSIANNNNNNINCIHQLEHFDHHDATTNIDDLKQNNTDFCEPLPSSSPSNLLRLDTEEDFEVIASESKVSCKSQQVNSSTCSCSRPINHPVEECCSRYCTILTCNNMYMEFLKCPFPFLNQTSASDLPNTSSCPNRLCASCVAASQ